MKEPKKISQKGIELIKSFEGLKLKSYKDAGGVWTIGYGHTRTAGPNQIITKEQAEDLLIKDINIAEIIVNQMVKVPLTQNQFDALVSLVFNVGGVNFKHSILLTKLNQGKYKEASEEFLKWTKAKLNDQYVELPGLVKRRKKEKELFDGKA
ncbi:MAG: lysozyme [Ignavibacteria bacterium]|nr:lysozyme [Ignavibacteria bacterium]